MCLLLMDNAPAHPSGLEEDLLENLNSSKFSSSLPTPCHLQVISNFKKLYTKFLFHRCFNVTESTNLTLKEFWKYHFDIVNCLSLIDKAWEAVTIRTLNSAWQKLWPEAVPDSNFEGFTAGEGAPVEEEEIVAIGHDMGLEMDTEDVNDLIAEHADELTTEELVALQEEQQEER